MFMLWYMYVIFYMHACSVISMFATLGVQLPCLYITSLAYSSIIA